MQKASTGIKTEKVVREISGLKTEVSKADIKVTVVPVVIRTLGIVSGKLATNPRMIGVKTKIELLWTSKKST